MRRTLCATAVICALSATGVERTISVHAQGCSADQRLDAAGRQRDAIARARNVRDRQAARKASGLPFATAAELGLKDDNGFTVTLRAGTDGYMVLVLDTMDPCSFGVLTDQTGRLFEVRPLR